MNMRVAGLAHPKGETRKRTKARKDRHESAVIEAVRAACVARDGYCRFAFACVGPCEGRSEWAHLPPRQRWATRGMEPEYRHCVEWSAMACKRHHDQIDGRTAPRLHVVPESDAWGAQGALWVATGGTPDVQWLSVPVPKERG